MFKMSNCVLLSLLLGFVATAHAESGETLYKQYCDACHGLNGGIKPGKRLAPPMEGVKRFYLRDYPAEAAFVQAVSDWVKSPSLEKSKMPGAVRRFGLMPAFPLSEEQLQKIGAYIFTQELEAPEGFDEHFKKRHGAGAGRHHSDKP